MGGPHDSYEEVYDSDPETHLGFDGRLVGLERPPRRDNCRSLNMLSHLAALGVGVILCLILLEWKGYRFQESCSDIKLRRSSLVPEELSRYSETVRFNGTLEFPSIYRGTWEEVDDAWLDVVNIGFLDADVTDEDIRELGADPETLARFPEEDGGGYVMTIEYTHQIHCLDLLRRVNPWNYPDYMKQELEMGKRGDSTHTEEMFRTHVDHCVEMLRQVLMCHADTTPIFQQWVSIRGNPWPNFNTVHQCRDFNAIHKWSQAHAKGTSVAWPIRPEGAKALAIPP